MASPLPWVAEKLEELRRQHLLRARRTVTPLPDGWCLVDGRRLRNFASNDYLNLAHDERLHAAARETLDRAGVGARASALVSGRTDWHQRLEQRLARFEGQPAALLFPTGYAANLGTISALVEPDDVIFCDRFNHASLVDGCRLSGARLRVYRHTRLETLRRALQKCTARRRWIVTDTVFSMDGDWAPLPELCELSERYEAPLIIDEAHATGVLGPSGRGVAEWQGVEDRVAVRVGTLSKAVGCLGGFVSGSRELVDWLWNRARTQVYSTALPPSVCAAACRAIDIIEEEPERRERLLAASAEFRRRLNAAGIETIPSAAGPIVPVLLHQPDRATHVATELERRGFFVAAIRPPTVPQGTSRLRITLTAAHSRDDLQQLADTLAEVIGALHTSSEASQP
ncbi:MAG TPA: 8-amino-7-oxononanoate synthase [Planctomycetaceae bacterium]|nr:8-amino-7-oxononanoate synthase [Planctomycetaceae bacterium]